MNSMMRLEFPPRSPLAFTWHRGRPTRLGFLYESEGSWDRLRLITNDEEAEEYSPLEAEPYLYLRFGDLTRLSFEDVDAFNAAAVDFTFKYGLLEDRPIPKLFPSDPDPAPSYPLERFFEKAVSMETAVLLLTAISRAREDNDYSGFADLDKVYRKRGTKPLLSDYTTQDLPAAAWRALAVIITAEIGTVGLAALPLTAGIIPMYICTSLLSAMWVQIFQAAVNQRIVRICPGCNRSFDSEDPRQRYHDKSCRKAANSREHYRRLKEGR
jgi:hypothetical protein